MLSKLARLMLRRRRLVLGLGGLFVDATDGV
jgi:hypothetical protein